MKNPTTYRKVGRLLISRTHLPGTNKIVARAWEPQTKRNDYLAHLKYKGKIWGDISTKSEYSLGIIYQKIIAAFPELSSGSREVGCIIDYVAEPCIYPYREPEPAQLELL